jgi:hypothetical protein
MQMVPPISICSLHFERCLKYPLPISQPAPNYHKFVHSYMFFRRALVQFCHREYHKAIIIVLSISTKQAFHIGSNITHLSSSSSSTKAGVLLSFRLFGRLCLALLMLLAESSGASSLAISSPGSQSLSLAISLPSAQFGLS